MDELTLTLQHPLTDEEWDAIVDVDFEYTNEITFYTKNGKKVDFVKKPQWIPCSERLPDEDHWLGGSGKQFSDNVLISVVNYNDEDAWVQVSQTIDGTWALELPRYCKALAWMPLPPAYKGE